jgi:Fe-S-cluster-containing dehydrogenase component
MASSLRDGFVMDNRGAARKVRRVLQECYFCGAEAKDYVPSGHPVCGSKCPSGAVTDEMLEKPPQQALDFDVGDLDGAYLKKVKADIEKAMAAQDRALYDAYKPFSF